MNASVGTHTARGDGTGFAAAGADAARQRGVLFVASAGNEADLHWGGSFVDRNGNGLHEFAPGVERLEIAGVNDFRVLLRWDDWRSPSLNLDLELLDEAGNVVATSRNAQGADGKAFPLELIPWRAPRATRFFVQVRSVGAARDVRLDVFVANGSVVQPVAAGSVSTPGDALGALTVGATDVRSDQLESYSSRGPTLDGRFKPEVTAPTNVSTATSTRMGEPFNGTSASTPHVAAAAALLLSARPTLTVDQLFRYFQDGAKDLNQPGIDHETGYGRLQLGDPARIEPPPQVAPPAGQSFADDFKDPGSGLPVTSDARYVNGSYRIRVTGGRANVASYPRSFGSFSAQVTATPQPAESLLVYGLSFWQQSRDEYVTFGVTSDGQYFVARYQRGNWQDLVPWTRHQAIRPNGLNLLKVETQGSQIRVYANDQLLREVAVPGSRPGILGLNAAGLGAAAGEVTFTNLAVTARP
ncbi:MAG: S8 family serine peptidase [Chloroflexi bacterium]|nr:S8 family serine peptidase [Chloroflexota bacterium]